MGLNLLVLFPPFSLFKKDDLSVFFSDFEDVQGVLLFDFHHGPSELNSFVEVLENLFFDSFHVLFFVDPAANTTTAICVDSVFGAAVSALNSGKFVFIFDEVFSEFEGWTFFAELEFKFLNFPVKVINDVFILTDVKGHQLFVSYGLGLDIFSSVGVF